MPVPIDCPSCKGRLLIPDALWQQHFAARVQRMTCKRCGKVVSIDGRTSSPVASTSDGDPVPESQARRLAPRACESEGDAEQAPSARKPAPAVNLWPLADLNDPNLWQRIARDTPQPPPSTGATVWRKIFAAGRTRWMAVFGLAAAAGLGAAYYWLPWGTGSAAAQTAAPPPPAAPSADEVGIEVEPAASASTPEPTIEAPAAPASPVPSAPAHDAARLKEILRWAVRNGQQCHKEGRATGTAQLFITFEPSGKVSQARLVGEPIASAPVARCILDYARAIFLPPFDGASFTVSRTITLR